MSQDRWGRTRHGICSSTSSGIGFRKVQTFHPPFKGSHQATLGRMLCLNGQTSSSLTGRTSALPKIELESRRAWTVCCLESDQAGTSFAFTRSRKLVFKAISWLLITSPRILIYLHERSLPGAPPNVDTQGQESHHSVPDGSPSSFPRAC